MSTRIDFDEIDEEEDVGDENKPILVDALIPPFGWIPAEQVSSTAVRLLNSGTIQQCSRTAPLYSRSLKDEFSEVCPGQGCVYVADELDPSGQRWRAVVEALDYDEIIIRTIQGEVVRTNRSAIFPFYDLSEDDRVATPNRPDRFVRRRPYEEMVETYRDSLVSMGFRVVPMQGDGNCLFRAASHQLYGVDEYHFIVRQACAEYMSIEKTYFEPFVAEVSERIPGRSSYSGFDEYVQALRIDGTWGDDPELQAICEIYQRPVEVYIWDKAARTARVLRRLNDDNGNRTSTRTSPMRFSFMGGGHYDSIVDIRSTILTNVKPGMLEARALETAKSRRAGGMSLASKLSDELETERAQLELALAKSRQGTDEARATGYNLQEALELSLKSVAAQDSKAIENARLESLREAEELEMERVLQASLKDVTAGPSSSPSSSLLFYQSEKDMARLDEENLRRAMEASLRGGESKGTTGATTTTTIVDSSLSEEDMIRIAIEESLRNS